MTAKVTRNSAEVTLTNGSKVYNGEILTITVAGDTGYTAEVKYNGAAPNDSDQVTVGLGTDEYIVSTDEINIYALTITEDSNVQLIIVDDEDNVYVDGDTVTHGTQLTITAAYAEGYEADSLTAGGSGISSGDEVTITADTTIAATSKLKTYILSIDADANTTITVTDEDETAYAHGESVPHGTVLTITAAYADGYEVDTLTADGSAIVSGDDITVTDAISIAATAKLKTYTLDIEADANTTITVVDGDETEYEDGDSITHGTVLTVTAAYADGFEKETLTVDEAAAHSGDTVTVSGAVAIVATAKLKTYILNITADANTTITVTDAEANEYDDGDSVTHGTVLNNNRNICRRIYSRYARSAERRSRPETP